MQLNYKLKIFTTSVILLASYTMPGLVSADISNVVSEMSTVLKDTHVGLDILQSHGSYESGLGSNLFTKTLVGSNIYVGHDFTENFGVNVGYHTTITGSRDSRIGPGDKSLGITMPSNMSATYKSKVKKRGVFADLVAKKYVDLLDAHLFASVGIINMKVEMERKRLLLNGRVNAPQTTKLSKTKSVLRLNFGVLTELSDQLAAKVFVGWQNTSRIDPTGTTPAGVGVKAKLKNSVNYGLGIQYKFG